MMRLRFWTWVPGQRTPKTYRELGTLLAFVAGATNAGGFLAVGYYTSHMTGIISGMADNLVLGNLGVVLAGLVSLVCFLLGAMSTALIVNWSRRHRLHSQYALPLVLESMLLMLFGTLGQAIEQHVQLVLPGTVLLLCYLMGLQNALITKLSRSEIRTTHITGMITDMGIELGKVVYFNRSPHHQRVVANREKLIIHSTLVCSFFMGGVAGAIGFKHGGLTTALWLATALLAVSFRPVVDDIRIRYRWYRLHSSLFN